VGNQPSKIYQQEVLIAFSILQVQGLSPACAQVLLFTSTRMAAKVSSGYCVDVA
jgi:hypothetical protein